MYSTFVAHGAHQTFTHLRLEFTHLNRAPRLVSRREEDGINLS